VPLQPGPLELELWESTDRLFVDGSPTGLGAARQGPWLRQGLTIEALAQQSLTLPGGRFRQVFVGMLQSCDLWP
jgi:hypothetical protein